MREILIGIVCMVVIAFASSFILDAIDYSSKTTFTSENNTVRLSSDLKKQ